MIANCTAVILVGGGSRRIGVDNAVLLLSFRLIFRWKYSLPSDSFGIGMDE